MSESTKRVEQKTKFNAGQVREFLTGVPDSATVSMSLKTSYSSSNAYVLRAVWDSTSWPVLDQEKR